MKKLLLLTLALTIVGGVFAQELSLSGGFWMDMGWGTTSFDDKDVEDVSEWYWGPGADGNDGTGITVSIDGGIASGYASLFADKSFAAGASVGIIDNILGLSIGYARLPFEFWSSYDTHMDNHWAFGASSISKTAFFQVNLIDNVFIGIADGGKINGLEITDKDFLPYIYAGYSHPEDGPVAFGIGFAGTNIRGRPGIESEKTEDWDKEPFGYFNDDGDPLDVFAWMAKGYFKFLGIDNVSLGVNVAFYSAPEFTIFDIKNNGALSFEDSYFTGGYKEDAVLEALLSAEIGIPDICDIGLGVGVVLNLADEKENGGSFGLKFGMDAGFDIGGTGFSIIPGFSFAAYNIKSWDSSNNKANDPVKFNVLDFGISFCYSF